MFLPKKLKRKPTKLQIEIDDLVSELNNHKPESKEYGIIVERLSKLHTIRKESLPDRLSWNTGATVSANLLGILMIVHHEHLFVVTSKALSFVKKV
jgi:hypothetical protein